MRAKLINLGRQNFCGEVEFKTIEGLLREIKKHLMSRVVELCPAEEGSKKASIIVGGWRRVGEVELLDTTFHFGPVVRPLIITKDKETTKK